MARGEIFANNLIQIVITSLVNSWFKYNKTRILLLDLKKGRKFEAFDNIETKVYFQSYTWHIFVDDDKLCRIIIFYNNFFIFSIGNALF